MCGDGVILVVSLRPFTSRTASLFPSTYLETVARPWFTAVSSSSAPLLSDSEDSEMSSKKIPGLFLLAKVR